MTASLFPQNLVLELQSTFACFLHDVPFESTVTPLKGGHYKSQRLNYHELNASSVCLSFKTKLFNSHESLHEGCVL